MLFLPRQVASLPHTRKGCFGHVGLKKGQADDHDFTVKENARCVPKLRQKIRHAILAFAVPLIRCVFVVYNAPTRFDLFRGLFFLCDSDAELTPVSCCRLLQCTEGCAVHHRAKGFLGAYRRL